jgi:hypothetical protein
VFHHKALHKIATLAADLAVLTALGFAAKSGEVAPSLTVGALFVPILIAKPVSGFVRYLTGSIEPRPSGRGPHHLATQPCDSVASEILDPRPLENFEL